MQHSMVKRYGRALAEILFIRLYSDGIGALSAAGKVFVYMASAALYYAPILWFTAIKCYQDRSLIPYAVVILLAHLIAKVMLCGSKNVQRRFTTIKKKKHFLIRTWLIIEYVGFMWLVYLLYPLTCIFMPVTFLFLAFEHLFGSGAMFEYLLVHYDIFMLVGGILSYVVFIIGDGYKRLRSGFMPDYLALYAVLTILSVSFEGVTQRIVGFLEIDIGALAGALSWIYSLSGKSMTIVASATTLVYALRSLYNNCGTGDVAPAGEDPEEAETEVGDGVDRDRADELGEHDGDDG